MLKTKQRNHTAPAAGGLQKIQEVKAEVQISRLVVKLAMVYDGDLTMKSPWNPHEIPMKSHLSEVVNFMGDVMMGISWDLNGDFLMRIWMAWKTGF